MTACRVFADDVFTSPAMLRILGVVFCCAINECKTRHNHAKFKELSGLGLVYGKHRQTQILKHVVFQKKCNSYSLVICDDLLARLAG